jgi:hypothetical protein
VEQSFSQRMGFRPVKSVIQVDIIDDELRTALWNDFYYYIWTKPPWTTAYTVYDYIRYIWTSYFHKAVDQVPDQGVFLLHIRKYFFECEWHSVYDFMEVTVNIIPFSAEDGEFINKTFNTTLTRELSGYRFVDKRLVPITSTQEIAEVEEALSVSMQFTPHLGRALELLADKNSPDYRNSMKESISAVEALCKLIVGSPKATLEEALRQIETKLGFVHPALKEAFRKIYAYSGDAQGIRHAWLGESNLDVEDAKFMLIACSAFINYLVVKADKAGIQLPQK